MKSGDVDRTLRTFRGLTRGARHRRRIQEELADHLHEACADEQARGLGLEAAERRSVERFGDPVAIAEAFPTSRWRWPVAAVLLAGVAALVWADVATHQASIRTCLGGRCPTWVPEAPQHPIRERVEAVTAAAAALLAIWMAISARWRRHRATRAYQAALANEAETPRAISTATLVRDALRWPARTLALVLTVVVVAGASFAVRWQTDGPPSIGVRVLALRQSALRYRSGTVTGSPRARPLLRQILSQIPGAFASVGVHPGRGLVIGMPAWADVYSDATTSPNLLLSRFESEDLAIAFDFRQADAGLHVVRFGFAGADMNFGRTPISSGTSIPDLRGHITRKLHRLGLDIVSLHITHPYGPLAVAVARTSDPRHYLEAPPGPLNRHITWGALVIEDMSGVARIVYTTQVHGYTEGEWSDPRLFSAQPAQGGGEIPPPVAPPKPAPRLRAPRA